MRPCDFIMEYQKLSKKALGCMRLAAAFGTVIFALFLITARVIMFASGLPFLHPVDIVLLFLLLIFALYAAISPNIRYLRYRYYIDNEKVVVLEGLIFITKSFVPVERIHQITVQKGPIDRLYGLGKVIITTAGGTVVMRFLEEEKAEQIAELLRSTVSTLVRTQGASTDE
ncbi:MAG: PH domain-containing protein [Clostridiales bacterium]|nr:PH domain-containing protein [Clostridiales bacterium]